MKIDAIQRKSYQTLDRKSQNKVQRKKDCYTCEKIEYFLRECTQNKYKNKFSSYDRNDKIIAVTKIA